MLTGRLRRGRRRRRYGVVLDGPVLAAAVVEDGRVVATESVSGPGPAEVLAHWLRHSRPAGPVTVALVSGEEHTADLELPPGMPESLFRRRLEEGARAQFPRGAGPFAVTASIAGRRARVIGVPARALADLWRHASRNLRFTLSPMTYSVAGIHLSVGSSATELHLVAPDADTGRPVLADSMVLGAGGLALEAGPDEAGRHAEQVAQEVERALQSWRRRGLPVHGEQILVGGANAPYDLLSGSLAARGYRPELDPVAGGLDLAGIEQACGPDRVGMLRSIQAAAAAITSLAPCALLEPPAGDGASPVAVATRWTRRKAAFPLVAGASAVAMVACVAVPVELGRSALAGARRALAQAEATRSAYRDQISLYDYDAALRGAVAADRGAPWARIVPAVVATMPPPLTIQTMTLLDRSGLVGVTVTASGPDPGLFPQWLATLQHDHVDGSTTGVTVAPSSGATATLTFTVPEDF